MNTLKVQTMVLTNICPLEFVGNKEKIEKFIDSLSSLVFLEDDFEIYGVEDETKIIIEPLTIYDLQLLVKQAEKMGLIVR